MQDLILQVALDFIDLDRALKLAEEAVEGGADWLEAGTPLIKSAGMDAIRKLKEKFHNIPIVADMKTMDVGRIEVEMAAKAGAHIVSILGAAHISTIAECIEAGKHFGAKIMVDMLEVKDYVELAKKIEELGADYISLHIPIDEQMLGKISFENVKAVASNVNIPVAIAGGLNSENIVDAIKAGATILIVGGAITKSKDATKATREIKEVMRTLVGVKTELYTRVSEEKIIEVLKKVSVANISDALHRAPVLYSLRPLFDNIKIVGKAYTVRTYPGDWAKPVEAIDLAKPGDVLVIDAGGSPVAIWGELATHSALRKGLAGVVINGGVRDTMDIRKLKFPVFARYITGQAGEPKGFGEVDVPIVIDGVRIEPGDYIVGDDDGVVVLPKGKAVEYANRAMDVLERENRIRQEIQDGGTLGEVTELLKWEKK